MGAFISTFPTEFKAPAGLTAVKLSCQRAHHDPTIYIDCTEVLVFFCDYMNDNFEGGEWTFTQERGEQRRVPG